MNAIAEARAQLRAAVARCPSWPVLLERKVALVRSLLDTAEQLGRGHGTAIAEAVKVLGELERHTRATSRQGELFPIGEVKPR